MTMRSVRLSGTKLACEEGACGSCTVVIGKVDHTGKPWSVIANLACNCLEFQFVPIRFQSANACVTPLYLVDGCCVMTVEGLGNVRKGIHPIQERLARGHGSQCGFCTPGFVMSMYALIRNNAQPSVDDVDAALRGQRLKMHVQYSRKLGDQTGQQTTVPNTKYMYGPDRATH